MSFDSLAYLIFLPAVWVLYQFLQLRGQNLMLLAASYLFYGWWDTRFLFLIVLSTCVDYLCGIAIESGRLTKDLVLRSATALIGGFFAFIVLPTWLGVVGGSSPDGTSLNIFWIGAAIALVCSFAPLAYRYVIKLEPEKVKKVFLTTSIFTNLGLLGVFKYFDFFISSAEDVARTFGMVDVELLHLDIVLPVGISFYTFQTLSYSIGVYRGEVKPTRDFAAFSLFVGFFPQLVAGPIERASNLLPRILNHRKVTLDGVADGLFLILLGLFKKVGIANGLAGSVDSVFNSSGAVSGADVFIASTCFAIQIYCDFSGYSDIARGTSKLFGIDLMRNFSQPHFMSNPTEFWQRWHISLSTWLRDYLYISLGGNRKGNLFTYRNLFLTMLLGGLWHGAAWNYVLWGAYQGLILCIHRILTGSKIITGRFKNKWTYIFWVGLFFFIINAYAWLLFRATSFDQIAEFTRLLFWDFELTFSIERPTFSALLGIPMLLLLDVYFYRSDDVHLKKLYSPLRGAIYAALLLVMFMGMSNDPTQFIYFQF